jgi:hypothetical protein
MGMVASAIGATIPAKWRRSHWPRFVNYASVVSDRETYREGKGNDTAIVLASVTVVAETVPKEHRRCEEERLNKAVQAG